MAEVLTGVIVFSPVLMDIPLASLAKHHILVEGPSLGYAGTFLVFPGHIILYSTTSQVSLPLAPPPAQTQSLQCHAIVYSNPSFSLRKDAPIAS